MSVLLMTVLPGSSKVPEVASTARLRALGAAAAALHQVSLTPRAELPLRLRPVADADLRANAGQQRMARRRCWRRPKPS